nr:MAG TPA: hypothetical protein [Ackermannviridae sp.]
MKEVFIPLSMEQERIIPKNFKENNIHHNSAG